MMVMQQEPLENALLQLFDRGSDKKCCSGSAVRETKTKGSGDFDFNNLPTGKYWLVAHVKGQSFQQAVEVKDEAIPDSICKQQCFWIDDHGRFSFSQCIKVD